MICQHRYIYEQHLDGCDGEERPHLCVSCQRCRFAFMQLMLDVVATG